jgi:hypothetical protein
MLRFFKGDTKQNWEHEKNTPPRPLVTIPHPLELAKTVPTSPTESRGVCRTFLMALPKKDPFFVKNHKELAVKVAIF